MEAVLFFTTVTFLIAVGAATVQGVLLYKKYRIRLHVTNKTPSVNSRDLENQNPGLHSVVAEPTPLLHAQQGSNGVRRWPESTYYDPTNPRWTTMTGMTGMAGIGLCTPSASVDRRHMSNPFVPFQGAPILEEISERSPTPATVSHLTPATDSRDQQGFVEQKP